MMKTNKILLALASLVLLVAEGEVFAAGPSTLSSPSTQKISITVAEACTITAPPAATFPRAPAGVAISAAMPSITGTINANCTSAGSTASLIGADGGANLVGLARNMKNPANGNLIPYTVQTTTGTEIGTTGIVGVTVPFSAIPLTVNLGQTGAVDLPVSVSLIPGTVPTAGTYTDTISYFLFF